MDTYSFSFPSFIRDEFDKKFAKLNKKLVAMPNGEEVSIVSENFEDRKILKQEPRKKVKSTQHLPPKRRYEPTQEDYLDVIFTKVEVSIPAVNKIRGYKFAGTINIRGDVKTIFAVNDDVNLSEVDVKVCHHCNTRRKHARLHVFTEVATGEHKAIGSTCVHEYLGVDIDKVLNTFSNFYKEDDLYGSRGMREAWGYPIEELANAVRAAYVMNPTYVKVKTDYYYNDNATKSVVDRYHTIMYTNNRYDQPQRTNAFEVLKSAPKVGRLLVETYEDMDAKESNFNSNIVDALFYVSEDGERKLRDFIVGKARGIFVWACYNALNKEVKSEVKKHAKPSDHVGKVGERIEVSGQITFTKTCEGYYGSSRIVKFIDNDGNEFVTFGTGKKLWDLERGMEVHGKGTVSKHDEFKGVKQTCLKRLTVA